jgi:hypothetical protein
MAGLQLRPSIKADYMEARMAEKQDMSAANDSYARFITMFKWGTVLSVAAAAIVVLIIA